MNRNISNKINKLLDMFPVVAIIGARQCGKTTLSKLLKPDWTYIDLEKPSDFNRIERDPEFFFQQYPKHVIIDEAQLSPKIFEVLRSVIDESRKTTGRFILTSSSSPELLKKISETLAGRIATIELGTFKANELKGQPLSAFYEIFQKPITSQALENLPKPSLTLEDIRDAWINGGYPEPNLKKSHEFFLQWMENYEATYIYRDIARLYPKLNKTAYQRFLTMLCKLSGTILNKSEIARALEVSEGSIREYFAIAEGTFLWRSVSSYENSVSKSIVKMPKGYVRDSGLLHTLLNITSESALYNDPIVGNSFESFVIEEIIKGLQATMLTHWSYHYYRTRSGAEVDLILKGPFGIIPIEIKYGVSTKSSMLKNLKNFVIDNELPFGLLINQSTQACWLDRYIYQLPASYL
ncbi:MAG: ATP-binding protein [Candidatus Berkiella sp.]